MPTRKNSRRTVSVLSLVEAEAQTASLAGRNRVVLMGMKDELFEVFRRGYKWKVAWKALQKADRIDMSYDTFRNHCRAMGLEIQPKSTAPRGSAKAKRRGKS